jgi:uncharacterized protein YecE (DUF72 family)
VGSPINASLFGSGPHRAELASRLETFAAENIFIGTSSWKYEGWLDQIYSRDRYRTRGKFSKQRFESECLAEYAETFPIVCGDFSFYQFPSPEYWKKLFASAPDSLKFGLKVPEEVTCEVFPKHARYGPRAGLKNESFLNADAFRALFLEPLEPYASRVVPLIFEFGSRSTAPIPFTDQLDRFLDALPGTFRYSVEVRNREFLVARYFEALRAHNIAHVFDSWTRMPPISEQAVLPGAVTAEFTVVRALLRPGRAYEDAVKIFSPYDQIREENPEAREALRALIKRMREERRKAYIFVNNRLEGNAPETIRAVIAE